jgi:hypothetical protein
MQTSQAVLVTSHDNEETWFSLQNATDSSKGISFTTIATPYVSVI